MKREIKVGLTVMAALVLLYLMVAWAKRIHFFSPQERMYSIRFEDVAGLLQGDPVKVRGYLAGRVLDIRPEAERVMVRISLDADIPLYTDARAEIQLKELMGSKQITLYQGSGGPVIDPSRAIPGRTAMDFSSAFSTMGRITEGFEAAEFNRMLQNLTILLERLASVSQEIDPGQVSRLLDRLDRLAANLDQVVGEAQERRLVGRLDTTLRDGRVLIDNANRSFEEINRIAGAVDDSSLQRVNDILDELYTTLETTRETVGQANDLLSQLQSDSSLAGRLIYDPALSQSVDSTLREFLRVLDQIQNRRIPVGIKFGKGKAQE